MGISRPSIGSLKVSKVNPRYFTIGSVDDASRQVVYLTGSHIWNNFHDGMGPGPDCSGDSESMDFKAYLKFLKDHGHNFIRLWRWEHFKSKAAGNSFHLCMTPQPWLRTGSEMAKDNKPKFDLSTFDQTYFDRLRERVTAARNEDIYVSVMFFEGWALHLSPAPDTVEGHPFHDSNNVNGINVTSIRDCQVLPLDRRVQGIQEAYIRKVIDTVHDLPNVLYEVVNESCGGGSIDKKFAQMMGFPNVPDWGDSTPWQYWVINFVKQYEDEKGLNKHPIGMTMQFPVMDQTKVNDPLFNGPADWISPGYDDEIFVGGRHPMAPGAPPSRWFANPPPSDGRKVVITDTDHYAAGKGNALWAWKSFLRGHNPILMDFGIISGMNPSNGVAETPSYGSFESARYAMGDTLRYARRMTLVDMTPRPDLSSTGYVLANPGNEYLVLRPDDAAEAFTVTLAGGGYTVEWYNLDTRETVEGGKLRVDTDGSHVFATPFAAADPAVLYVKHTNM